MKNEGKRCLNSMISELRSGEEMCRKFACVNNSNVVQYNKERKKTPFFYMADGVVPYNKLQYNTNAVLRSYITMQSQFNSAHYES